MQSSFSLQSLRVWSTSTQSSVFIAFVSCAFEPTSRLLDYLWITVRWITSLLVWISVCSGECFGSYNIIFYVTVSCVQRLRQKV